jgi:hypothetical protein
LRARQDIDISGLDPSASEEAILRLQEDLTIIDAGLAELEDIGHGNRPWERSL